MTLKFSIKKILKKTLALTLVYCKYIFIGHRKKYTVLALKNVSVKYTIKTFFCLSFFFWYFDWFLLRLPLKSMSKCQSNLFSSTSVSMPRFHESVQVSNSSYFPWSLCVLKKKCDISGTPRHAVLLAESSVTAQSHHTQCDYACPCSSKQMLFTSTGSTEEPEAGSYFG